MCRLQNIAMRDYQTDTWTDRRMDRQMPDKVIPMCRYALQATQKSWFTITLKGLVTRNIHVKYESLISHCS